MHDKKIIFYIFLCFFVYSFVRFFSVEQHIKIIFFKSDNV